MSSRVMGVKKPDLLGAGCWAVVRRYTGSLHASGTSCECRPRPGRLTCRHHAAREEEAQRLKASLTPEKLRERIERLHGKLAEIEARPERVKTKFGPSPRDQAMMAIRSQIERAEGELRAMEHDLLVERAMAESAR